MPTPFDDPTYTVLDELEAAIENTEASEAFADDASEATERRNQFAAATVILALVLFLVGIGMTFKRRSVNVASLALGGVLLVITALYAATLPVVF